MDEPKESNTVNAGENQITELQESKSQKSSRNMALLSPRVPVLMFIAKALKIVAGFGLVFGICPRLAAAALLHDVPSAQFLASHGHCLLYLATPQLPKEHGHGGWLALYSGAPSQPTLLPRSARSDSPWSRAVDKWTLRKS